MMIGGGLAYGIASIGMYQSWYKDSERSNLHLFNDWNEWNNLDKYGHSTTAYWYTSLAYKGGIWCGIPERKSLWLGGATSFLLQSTVEIMDGFSRDWGFSLADLGFNLLGITTFISQEYLWSEQRIQLKYSTHLKNYSTNPIEAENAEQFTSLDERTKALYGERSYTRLLKDYNGQTYWLTVNVHSFLKRENRWPKWLNIALGTGAEHMYGGFHNDWTEDGIEYSAPYERYSQFYLAPDIDLTRIPTKSPFLRTLLYVLNIFKIPGPAIEYNSKHQFKIHLIYF